MATVNAQNVMVISKAAQNNQNHPSTVNIVWARADFLNFDNIIKKSQILGKYNILETNGHSSVNIHWIWEVLIVLGNFWYGRDILSHNS